MKRKLQVFISSTYSDMFEERQAAVEAVLRAGHIPAGMELFAAGDESQLETIKRWIEDSDVYMLILGGRYGSIETNSGISYTEIEYDHAHNLKKPVFAIVIEEQALKKKIKKLAGAAVETDHGSELKAFRAKVLSRTSRFYGDAKDIKLSVFESLSDIMTRPGLLGWIKASELPNSDDLQSKINQLTEENTVLRKQIDDLQVQGEGQNGNQGPDFAKLYGRLKNTKVKTTVWNKEGNDTPREFSVLYLLSKYRDRFITGISNQVGITPVNSFFYFNVFPKLEIYQLAANKSVPGAQYRRYALTRQGMDLLAYIDEVDSNSVSK